MNFAIVAAGATVGALCAQRPAHAVALEELAVVNRDCGRIDEALEAYRRVKRRLAELVDPDGEQPEHHCRNRRPVPYDNQDNNGRDLFMFPYSHSAERCFYEIDLVHTVICPHNNQTWEPKLDCSLPTARARIPATVGMLASEGDARRS